MFYLLRTLQSASLLQLRATPKKENAPPPLVRSPDRMSPPKSNKCRRRRHRSIALRLFCHVSKQRRQCSLSQSVARSRSRFHEGGNDCEQKTNDGYIVGSKEGTQPTTFGFQISFLLLVTGCTIGLLVLVDNNDWTCLARPTSGQWARIGTSTGAKLKKW